MPEFIHLHSHTQYSLLDGAAAISSMYKKAAADGMKALTITDHGNMFGVFDFVAEASKHKLADGSPIKPIVGCEFYLVDDRRIQTFTKDKRDKRYHQLLIAKNADGYKNLMKLCSLGYIEGMYGKYPRIDKELIVKYHENLIASTCCIGAEVPQTILKKGEEEGRKVFEWWLNLFGKENYYIELQRHGMEEQEKVNQVLIKWAKEYDVKMIATNDSHYVDQQDSNAHDILLCINTGEKQSTPTNKEFGDDDTSMKGKRFAFFNDQFYFKTQNEMSELFKDVPQAIENTLDVFHKVEHLNLKKDILLPNFPVPKEFQVHANDVLNQWEFLKHLTLEGAHKRYKEMTAEIEERINFELHTIKTMGFPGYFLIVADFIKAGRDMGVLIGPGRGSAAGSVVAYCIGITNIDPIAYNLLFERFLNPDRKSLPDIDTDFDDEGRDKVIDYVVKKYGKSQVAQIVTYSTMAAKVSIKDVARVLDLPLNESLALTKLVSDRPGTELERLLHAPLDGKDSLKEKENYSSEEIEDAKRLRKIYEGDGLDSKVLHEAEKLEGGMRGTGVHAAGIIIAPSDLTEIIPIATSKETDLYLTQFEGKVIEDAGVIKMDFLGLKTLTIIRDALVLIEQNRGIKIDIDTIPLDDKKTFELYQRAETNGTFQFESAGMQKYLKDLKPDKFDDLIAMNALYRPGPIAYIPEYILRKHGKKVVYDLPEVEEFLKDTYGITVYQEQVMQLSQKLGGFTKGDADYLRKAMGKKDRKTLDKMKDKFITGAKEKNLDAKKLEKIWTDWEAFAQYAFNKSHSTCYAFVAFQTAYLKANYPGEYMSALLTNNQGNIDKITFFMEECRRMGVPVKGPDINESDVKFAVNDKGEIRYALSAIKGVGDAAVEAIVAERKANGNYKSIYDLTRRVSSRASGRKALEALGYAGAFDSFANYHRAQYFMPDKKDGLSLLEKAVRYGSNVQGSAGSQQNSLFGEMQGGVDLSEPSAFGSDDWSLLEKLKKEKEVTGIYISGHPLDDYRLEIQTFTNASLNEIEKVKGRDLKIAGIVTTTETKFSKNGNQYCRFTLEDFTGTYNFTLFGKDFLAFKTFTETPNAMLHISGRYQQRWNDENQFEFKISKIDLLSDIRNKLTKFLTLELEANAVDLRLIEDIDKVLAKYPGKTKLHLKFRDTEEGILVGVSSTLKAVELSNDLFKELDTLRVIYSLN